MTNDYMDLNKAEKSISKNKKNIRAAFDAGYRYTDGKVTINDVDVLLYEAPGKQKYLSFYFRQYPNLVHHLAAYQKYGDDWLYSALLIRHVDGNSHNNSLDNLVMGTHQENMMDIPVEQRRSMGEKGRNSTLLKIGRAKSIREKLCKLSYKDAENIRREYNNGQTQKNLAKEYNVGAGTIHSIVRLKSYRDDLGDTDNSKKLERLTEPSRDSNPLPTRLTHFSQLSKKKRHTVEMASLGYNVIDGIPYDPDGNKMHVSNDGEGYQIFTKRINNENMLIHVHKMVAYQKFKDEYLYSNLMVRHLDGNRINNSVDNIELGTNKQNQLDMPRTLRDAIVAKLMAGKKTPKAIENHRIASEKRCKYSAEQVNKIRKMHKDGFTNSDIKRHTYTPLETVRQIILKLRYNHIPEELADF